MKHPTNNEIWYAEQRDLAIEERDAAIARAVTAEAEVAELEAALNHQNTLRESLSDMIGIQSQDGNWNYNDYMCGLANGLLLAHATMTEGAYKPFSRPAQWIEEAAALQARIAELETENLALISRIVETDCRDYGRDEYQTQSLADQVLIDRLVAAGRMRHKCNDHKGRPIYEFVHASSEGGP